MTRVRGNSQNARILRALADGKWVTVAEIHRRAGTSRLNSRVSELRGYGYELEHDTVPGKVGALGHRYRLLGNPEIPEVVTQHPPGVVLARDEIPRDPDHRFRVYVRGAHLGEDDLVLVGTAPDESTLGISICGLSAAGQFNGRAVGILDTLGTDDRPGKWIINCWTWD